MVQIKFNIQFHLNHTFGRFGCHIRKYLKYCTFHVFLFQENDQKEGLTIRLRCFRDFKDLLTTAKTAQQLKIQQAAP